MLKRYQISHNNFLFTQSFDGTEIKGTVFKLQELIALI